MGLGGVEPLVSFPTPPQSQQNDLMVSVFHGSKLPSAADAARCRATVAARQSPRTKVPCRIRQPTTRRIDCLADSFLRIDPQTPEPSRGQRDDPVRGARTTPAANIQRVPFDLDGVLPERPRRVTGRRCQCSRQPGHFSDRDRVDRTVPGIGGDQGQFAMPDEGRSPCGRRHRDQVEPANELEDRIAGGGPVGIGAFGSQVRALAR